MAHQSVLLQESIDGLNIKEGEIFLDATFNDGGHSIHVCRQLKEHVKIIGIDLDSDALEKARMRFLEERCRISLYQENFRNLDVVLRKEGIESVDAILFDLGFSSVQLEESGRGFSFKREEPLLMTLSKESKNLTAYTIVNEWDEKHLETIIRHYGEERSARRIAEAIARARKDKPIETTIELSAIIENEVGSHRGKTHSATKTFQALRITVNDELYALSEGLEKGFEALAPGGRIAVISFHSLEDRIVKRYFRKMANEKRALLITKKPLTPTREECKENPRSRSAKLRIIRKN
ncbi:MAG: 16S rRNA (cytosine(1402)-N(4))-methyltransferase RsmH [Candidatus Paceibacterota bacterium]